MPGHCVCQQTYCQLYFLHVQRECQDQILSGICYLVWWHVLMRSQPVPYRAFSSVYLRFFGWCPLITTWHTSVLNPKLCITDKKCIWGNVYVFLNQNPNPKEANLICPHLMLVTISLYIPYFFYENSFSDYADMLGHLAYSFMTHFIQLPGNSHNHWPLRIKRISEKCCNAVFLASDFSSNLFVVLM